MINSITSLITKELERDTKTGCLIFFIALALIFGIVMLINALGAWLWGIIAVGIFGLPTLTFWQFFGLCILLSILLPHSGSASSSKD